jgi:Ca-activated chloride channel homolog
VSLQRTLGVPVLALALLGLQGQVAIEPRRKPPTKEPAAPHLRLDTNLVLVPVTVTDQLKRPVTGLEKGNFRVFDDKIEQAITHFAMEDDGVAVGFVFDTSGSMRLTLREARIATQQFFQTGEADDEYCLVEFDSRARLVVPLTRNPAEIKNQLLFSRSGGSTALVDAVYLALHEIRKSKRARKALVLISDGGDNSSRYTESELKNVLREADVLIYSVGIGCEQQQGCHLLSDIARQTGGLYIDTRLGGAAEIAQKIIIDLRNRYVLGYAPADQQRDGRYHRIHVQLVLPRGLPKVNAYWRMGYYAPSQ